MTDFGWLLTWTITGLRSSPEDSGAGRADGRRWFQYLARDGRAKEAQADAPAVPTTGGARHIRRENAASVAA